MCLCFSVVLGDAVKNGVAALTSKIDFKAGSGDQKLTANSILRWDKLIQAHLLDKIFLLTNKITMSSIFKKIGAWRIRANLYYEWKMNLHEYESARISLVNKSRASGAAAIYRSVRSPPTWRWLANNDKWERAGRAPPLWGLVMGSDPALLLHCTTAGSDPTLMQFNILDLIQQFFFVLFAY
jgi:hypothetical protein